MHVASFTLIHDNLGLVVSIVLFPGRLWLQLQAEADRNSNQAGWRSHVRSSLGSGPACPSTLTPRLSFSRHANSPEADVRGPLVMGLQDSHCGWSSHWRSSWYPLLSRRCWSLTSAWRWGDVSMTSLTVSFRLFASGRQGPGWPG